MQRQTRTALAVAIIFAMVLTEAATDAYAPSLPQLQHALAASHLWAQMTVGFYLIGLALAGLVSGPLSDRLGRRPFLVFGMALFTLCGALCALTNSVVVLCAVRFFQGLGGGTVTTVGMAALTDIHKGRRRAQIISLAIMTLAFSPGIAPILGSQVAEIFSWQATFWVLSALSMVGCFFIVFSVPETLGSSREAPSDVLPPSQDAQRRRGGLTDLGQAYVRLFRDRRFMGYTLVHALILAGLWTEYAGLPFIFLDTLHVLPGHYGYYCAYGVCFLILGTFFNHRWVMHYSLSRLILWGFIVVVVAHVLTLIALALKFSMPWLWQTLLGLKSFGCALVFGNAMTRALQVQEHHAGVCTAVISALEMSLSAACIAVLSWWAPNDFVVLNVMTIVLTAVALILFLRLRRRGPGAGLPRKGDQQPSKRAVEHQGSDSASPDDEDRIVANIRVEP